MDWTLKVSDLAIVFATLVGPVLAVQAQKWIERQRERRNAQILLFKRLMMTRALWLSVEHVQALNAVPLEFDGESYEVRRILAKWREYVEYFSKANLPREVWEPHRVQLFVELMAYMSSHLGFHFTEHQIRNEVYSPVAHSHIQTDQDLIRRGMARLLSGDLALPMDVKTFPVDPEMAAAQLRLQRLLTAWLEGGQSVNVAVTNPDVSRTS